MPRRHLKKYRIEWSVRPKRIGWGVISDFGKFLDCADKGYEAARRAIINPLAGKKDRVGLYDCDPSCGFNPVSQSNIFVVDNVERDFSAISVYEIDDDGCYDEGAAIAELDPMEMRVCEPNEYPDGDRAFFQEMASLVDRKSKSVPFGACSQNGEDWITAGFTLQLGGVQEFCEDRLELVNGKFNTLEALDIGDVDNRCVEAFQLAYKGQVLNADEIPGPTSGVLHAYVGVVHPDRITKVRRIPFAGGVALQNGVTIYDRVGLGECVDIDGQPTKIEYKVVCFQPTLTLTMSIEDLDLVDFDELDRLTWYRRTGDFRDVGGCWVFDDRDPETIEAVKPGENDQRNAMPSENLEEKECAEACDNEDDDAGDDASESEIDEDYEEDEGDGPVEDVDDESEEISEKRLSVFRIIGVLFGWAGLHFLYAKRKKMMYLSLSLLLWAVVEYFLARPINFTAAPYSALRFQFAAGSVGLLWFLSVRYCEKDGCGRTMT